MKVQTKKVISLSLLCASILLAGCLSDTIAPKTMIKPETVSTNYVTITNTVSEVVTKTNVVLVNVTNTVTGAVTQTPQAQVETVVYKTPTIITNAIITTNAAIYTVDTERIETGVKTVGNIVGGLGVPFAGTAAAAIALLTHLVGSFFNRRQVAKLKDEHETAMDTANDAIGTLVQNVESIRGVVKQFPGGQKADDTVVKFISNMQKSAGVDVAALIKDAVTEHADNAPEAPQIAPTA